MVGKGFRTLDDIERDRENKERKEFKEKISGDLKDVFDDFFKPERKPMKKKSLFWTFVKWLGILFLSIFIINFILGNIWLLIHLIKYFFN